MKLANKHVYELHCCISDVQEDKVYKLVHLWHVYVVHCILIHCLTMLHNVFLQNNVNAMPVLIIFVIELYK